MNPTAGRLLAPAVLAVALALSPVLGYATTHVLLALAAVAAALRLAARHERGAHPSPTLPIKGRVSAGEVGTIGPQTGASTSPSTGEVGRAWTTSWIFLPTTLFALAFLLIAASALATARSPADLLPLFGFAALLFHAPLARLIGGADLSPYALAGTLAGLGLAAILHFGLGMERAGEGLWFTDPFRLAATTLVGAFLGLGLIHTGSRWKWLSLLGIFAAGLVILWTGSRGAMVALPVLLAVSGLMFRPRPLTVAATVAGTAAIAVAALFIELPGTVRARLWDVIAGMLGGGTVPDAAIDVRLGLYRAAADLFAASPLVGHGWGADAMPKVLALLSADQLGWGAIPHLHNDLAQFAVSGGLLGIAAWLLILGAPLLGYLRLPPVERSPARRHALLVLLASGVVFGIPDTMLAAPMTLTIYVVLTAAVTGRRAVT